MASYLDSDWTRQWAGRLMDELSKVMEDYKFLISPVKGKLTANGIGLAHVFSGCHIAYRKKLSAPLKWTAWWSFAMYNISDFEILHHDHVTS
nr:hypothetical protein Iba_scaffold23486CG0010 [Ipomoea batatas]